MLSLPLSAWWENLKQRHPRLFGAPTGPVYLPARSLTTLHQMESRALPRWVRESTIAMKYRRLLGPLNWHRFPPRSTVHARPQAMPVPWAAFIGAYLVMLDQHLDYMSLLHDYLVDHPPLTWVLGFPLQASRQYSWGFDVAASLPTHRHFSRLLRTMPNAYPQACLADSVSLLDTELATEVDDFGDCISLDTKHILAWVVENNPKAFIEGQRFDKHRQPSGDPDCRLGCKRKRNQRAPRTPTTNPRSASAVAVGDYYWGYATGVVATKVPHWGEFALSELTQTFDCSDVSYFFPLMHAAERRLGFRPHFGAFDAAFDAWYVYAYFHRPEQPTWHAAFAAVPFSERGGFSQRTFNEAGLPLCEAGLPMPLKATFRQSAHTLIPHQKGRYACPLLYPQATGECCPSDHPKWPTGGCVTTMATSIGARLRYQIDRDSDLYKQVYKQRTATERINSQAVALSIERPKLRNQASITNRNTLIYVLINLRALQRIRQRKAARQEHLTA